MPGATPPREWDVAEPLPPVEVIHADLRANAGLERLAVTGVDAVVHLAAIASGAAARKDPDSAFVVNSGATMMLASCFVATTKPLFLFVSTGEVYGDGHAGPITEAAPRDPCSPYAESKVGAEGALEAVAEQGLPVIIARAFPHTGPGQSPTYVLPALAARLKEAKRTGASSVRTGNLSAVRDFLDVRDVVRAYLLLLERGAPGEIYNIASGTGHRLADCFDLLAQIIGVDARAEQDAALLRPGDIPVLIGDATKLRNATGWWPEIPFERTLQDLVDAQAD
jgi:GDP-4-dehydro-6-deoxy-D-mannose reductase